MTGKKYADQYDHTQLLMAGRGLEQQINRGLGCHQFISHAVMALIKQAELRSIEQEILQGIEELEGMLR